MRIGVIPALFIGLAIGTSTPASAGGDGWVRDFEAAKATAASEGKDLLIDFTGSDWCGWCIRLDKEVFSQDGFKSVHDDFVLVYLDYPKDQSLVTDDERAQNEVLKDRFGIQGYPSIFLTDAQGRPYAQTGYQPGGPEKYLTHLSDLREKKTARDTAFDKASAAQGAEKARLLDEALAEFEDGVVFGCYGAEVDAIIAADSADDAGLRTKYAGKKVAIEIEGTANALAGKGEWAELVTVMDGKIKEYDGNPVAVQKAMYFKGFGYVRQEDLKNAITTLEVAEDLDGDEQLGKQISLIIRQLEQALEKKEIEEHGHSHGDGEHDHEHGDGGHEGEGGGV